MFSLLPPSLFVSFQSHPRLGSRKHHRAPSAGDEHYRALSLYLQREYLLQRQE